MFREKSGLSDVNTSHCLSVPSNKRKNEQLLNCDSNMVVTTKIEMRYQPMGEVR